jgi:hypothetical protein
MEHKRASAQLSLGDFGRFVARTRRGRVVASVSLAAAAVLGLMLGVLDASNTVLVVAVIVFVAIMVPVVLLQAIKVTRPPHDGQQ